MHRHTCQCRLIADKRLQLGKGPAMECCALRPSSPHPRANMPQILDGNRSLRAFGLRNNPFGETVVDMFGEPRFLPSKQTQSAAAVFCAFLLQLVSEPPVTIAHVLDRRARMDFSIAIDGDVCHPQVDTQHVHNIERSGLVHLAGHKQIPVAANKGQIRFATSRAEQRPLAFATHKRDGLARLQSPDRDGRIRHRERENAIIVGNRRCGAKRALGVRAQFVGICDLRQCTDDHLCCQAKGLAHVLVAQLLERELAKRTARPGHIADVVARRVGRFQRAFEGIGLSSSRQEFQLYRKFHESEYSTDRTSVQLSAKAG